MPNLATKKKCIGCTACESVCPKKCIKMKKDCYGFAYPEISQQISCAECGACEKVCPVLKDVAIKNVLPEVYAALSLDEKVRMESSSGGIFTELARRIIYQNGVVYGAAYNECFEVYHYCVDGKEDLHKIRGAKYAESNLGNSFIDILERLQQGQLVLFSGTPCQVAGLKSFVKKDFANLFCIDFVCHGIPSPMAWKSYVEYRAKEDTDGEFPYHINMRSKNTGWSKYQYSNVFEYKSGKQHSVLSSQSLFMKLFVENYISRPSCEECKFKGYNRISDITLGDFWGIWDIEPEMDDNKGTSVVLVHSDKGRLLWKEIDSQIRCKEVSLKQASQQNLSMLMPFESKLKRNFVLEKIKKGYIESCVELFGEPKTSIFTKIKESAKQLLRRIKT